MIDRRCKICGRILRVTQGDVGPVCAGKGKTKRKRNMSKKAYLRAIKNKDIFKGSDDESGKTTKTKYGTKKQEVS